MLRRDGEWISVGKSAVVRRLKLYDLDWDDEEVELENQLVAAETFGGLIAITPRPFPGSAPPQKSIIKLFTASGIYQTEFGVSTERGHIIHMNWTLEETLLIITANMTLYFMDVRGAMADNPIAKQEEVRFVHGYAHGAVIVTEANTMYVVVGRDRQKHELREVQLPADMLVKAVGVIPHESGSLDHPEILVSSVSAKAEKEALEYDEDVGGIRRSLHSIMLADDDHEIVKFDAAPDMSVHSFAITTNGNTSIAMFTMDSRLRVFSVELDEIILDVEVKCSSPPSNLMFCDADVVMLTFTEPLAPSRQPEGHDAEEEGDDGSGGSDSDSTENLAFFDPLYVFISVADGKVESFRESIAESEGIRFVQEDDSVRLVANNVSFLFERLEEPTLAVFNRRVSTLASQLIEATLQYDRGNVQGWTMIHQTASNRAPELHQAIETILQAAACEVDLRLQSTLLHVANFCKTFSRRFETEVFVDMCQRIRILNAVRQRENGIPLTFDQYKSLSGADHLRAINPGEIQVLVDRLTNRGQYQLGYNICVFVNMKVDKVLVHWAGSVVRQNALDDETTLAQVTKILKHCPGVGFAEVAQVAYETGRRDLAVNLLEREPRSRDKVLLLLSVKEDLIALDKAVQSGDVDLMLIVVMKIYRTQDGINFFRMIQDHPQGQEIFHTFCRAMPHVHGQELRQFMEFSNQYYLVGIDIMHDYCVSNHSSRGKPFKGRIDFDAFEVPDEQASPTSKNNISDSDSDPEAALNTSDFDSQDSELERFRARRAARLKKKKGKKGKATKTMKVTPIMPSHPADPTSISSDGSSRMYVDAERYVRNSPDLQKLFNAQAQLVKKQEELLHLDKQFKGAAPLKTVELCMANNRDADAEAIRNLFQISEGKWWSARLKGWSAAFNWDKIDELGGVRPQNRVKSPIGWRPFVNVLLENARDDQAVPYIGRLGDLRERVECYLQIGEFPLAIKDAVKEEDPQMLLHIRSKSTNKKTIDYINAALEDFR